MMDELDLDAIEAEHAASSPGEWTLVLSEGSCQSWSKDDCPRSFETDDGHQEECKGCEHWEYDAGAWFKGLETVDCGEYVGLSDADARFCGHAHQYVPTLIAEVRRLRAANAELRELVKDVMTSNYENYGYELVHRRICSITIGCKCGLSDWLARADKALGVGDGDNQAA